MVYSGKIFLRGHFAFSSEDDY